MRRLWISIFLMVLGTSLFGQTAKPKNLPVFDAMPAHMGYSVGVNVMGFTFVPNEGIDITVVQNPGININLVSSLKLAKYLDLRFLPGIQFGQRNITIRDINSGEEWDASIESVYIDLPILLKYRSERVNNYAPYLIAGINPRFDLTGGEIEDWKPAQRLIKAFDLTPELGVGLDFYLEKVKVSTELKFAVGLLNIYNAPPEEEEYSLYSRAFERIMSRMVIISINIG